MAIPLFLAAHPAEVSMLPTHYAWMACHFSEKGLANLPPSLPEGAMVIVTDEILPQHQDPEVIAEQLASIPCGAVLLDFQHPGCDQTARITSAIVANCRCPVGVTVPYSAGLDCAVFLSPVPPDCPLEEYLKPWHSRELWLDLSPSYTRITITTEGSQGSALKELPPPGNCHWDQELFCHYHIHKEPDQIVFDLWRTKEDLSDLLATAEKFGIARAIGLYQELGRL